MNEETDEDLDKISDGEKDDVKYLSFVDNAYQFDISI